MSKIDLTSNAWIDLIFQGKNKEYGAYTLRKGTSKRNFWAIIIMIIFAVLLFGALALKNIIEKSNEAAYDQGVEVQAITQKKEAKVEKKAPVKVEEVKKVEKVKSSIKFTAPVIKKDNEVKAENELKQNEDLSKQKVDIGAFNVKGNDEKGEILKAKEEIAQPEPPKVEEDKVFEVVEQQPQFKGNLNSWLSSHIKYPAVAEENGIQGRVVVGFVVGKDGSIRDVRVLRGADPSLDKEAVRLVSSMPRWTPGKQNGQAVSSKFTVPINFRLQ